MGSDWDDDSDSGAAAAPATKAAAVPAAKKRFADEDASSDDDVKDDWDASDDEDEEKKKEAAKPTGPAPPVRAKGITKQKIAEKEAAERQKLAEREAARSEDNDPARRKAREKAAMLKADLDNAASLFGAASIAAGGAGDPFAMDPRTKEQFEAFSDALADKVLERHGDAPLYTSFLEHFVKNLSGPLKDVEVRKIASTLTAVANEKQKAAKGPGAKKKGAAKPALGGGKTVGSTRDTHVYDDVLDDDYDDFM